MRMQTDKTHKHYKQWLAHMKGMVIFTNIAVLGFQLRCGGQRIRWRTDGLVLIDSDALKMFTRLHTVFEHPWHSLNL